MLTPDMRAVIKAAHLCFGTGHRRDVRTCRPRARFACGTMHIHFQSPQSFDARSNAPHRTFPGLDTRRRQRRLSDHRFLTSNSALPTARSPALSLGTFTTEPLTTMVVDPPPSKFI